MESLKDVDMYSEIDEKDKGMLQDFVTFMQEVKTFARLPSAQQSYEPASEISKK